MARVYASTLSVDQASEDERGTLSALCERLPGDEFRIWFHPVFPGRKPISPTLVAYDPARGLLVLEVGESAGAARRIAREAVAALRDRLRTDEALRDAHGDLRVPVTGFGVGAAEIEETISGWGPTPGRGSLEETAAERIRAAIEPQLHFLDLREESPPPVVQLDPAPALPPDPGRPVDRARALPGFWLDAKQARIARGLASPRTLVYGPAGSGKTVFLVARAQYWRDRMPEARVLFTCYNASLASHLRHVFALRGVPWDPERLVVRHYHQLLQEILGLEDMHEQPNSFYAGLEPRVLAELSRRDDSPAFDCILVDEGQDFTRRMIEVLVRLSSPGGEITLVCDPAQDIYGRWRRENLAPLRDVAVERLVDCYRNTAPIFALALAVLPPDVREAMGLERLEMTRPEDVMRLGPVPDLRPLPGLDDLVDAIVEVVSAARAAGASLADCAVLYTDRSAIPGFADRLRHSRWSARDTAPPAGEEVEPDDAPRVEAGTLNASGRDVEQRRRSREQEERSHFARALETELEARGIPAEWITRDYDTKSTYDISRPRLTLSTIHSAKGLDFHTVILLGAESLEPKTGEAGHHAAELLFTGITRARERLLIPYLHDRGWVPWLRERIQEVRRDATFWQEQETQ